MPGAARGKLDLFYRVLKGLVEYLVGVANLDTLQSFHRSE